MLACSRVKGLSIALGLTLSLAASHGVAAEDFGVDGPLAGLDFGAAKGDAGRLKAAFAQFAKGEAGVADAIAGRFAVPAATTAYQWGRLRRSADPSLPALQDFLSAHPGWAGEGWLQGAIEGRLFLNHPPAGEVLQALAGTPPRSSAGRYALARAKREIGDAAGADADVRKLWREAADEPWAEAILVRDEASTFTREDDIARAGRLVHAGQYGAASRAAARGGADVQARVSQCIAALQGATLTTLSPDAPGAAALAPDLVLAQARKARKDNRLEDAARWFALAPSGAALGDPDLWWQERRQLMRQLLDIGQNGLAYRLVAGANVGSPGVLADARFRSGWIALRFLNEPLTALAQFDASSTVAVSAQAHARADYWRARTLTALGDDDGAAVAYARAASAGNDYYGQLAARALGREAEPADESAKLTPAEGASRVESIAVAEQLFAAGQDDLAAPLSFAEITHTHDGAQAAAMARVMERYGDAPTRLAFGRVAADAGFAFEQDAFPVAGVPDAPPLALSADRPTMLAVMRQESGFVARAASGAGAHGLMQLLPGTARDAAKRAGVAFDEHRYFADPQFNLQLGGAYLGQLLADLGGDMTLTLAAYNAGPGRVQQWLQLYGDPRRGQTDMADWVERIPFDETHDYVQRVSEALTVYRARLAGEGEGGDAISVAETFDGR